MGRKRELHKRLEPYLNCKDYTVSGETYEVMFNPDYDMLVTSPIPVDLENYYKSEDYISHTDSKKSLLDKAYQSVKNYTLKRKLSLINSFKTEAKNILDVGAGTGDFLKVCAANNWNVLGVEPNSDARKIAKDKGVVLKEDLLQIENKKFDVITLWHVLEHVEMLSDHILKLKDLLSDEGRLIIAVPNHKSSDAKYYKEFWAAFDVPRHLWHFSQTSIHKIFSTENMIVENTIPMIFDAYYVSLLSEKYKTGKMNPIRAFYRGFISNLRARTSSEYSSLIYVIKKC
ncbi:class I SAM-dependent methyltransferase [Polaribacter sp. Hel1_85]|uniref:class I SAM-dependent methyltransferase n=1 Tax=Polaribacter sp. Hel1_85 TaxID=1250005 RepID=UPI00052B94B3|nr:class I SAM-dependent methyltransferase [Polaribacter sp. Hel1_85]KGL62410.1 SAM-dependent methyltransferase [Polaribacter sp. Hel1_85]